MQRLDEKGDMRNEVEKRTIGPKLRDQRTDVFREMTIALDENEETKEQKMMQRLRTEKCERRNDATQSWIFIYSLRN